MPGILHRWNDENGDPALQIDAQGHVLFGARNEAILTPEGGVAVWFQNRTGAASVKGSLVTLGTAPSSVKLVVGGVPNCIGAVYTSGVPEGQFVRVVISGIAHVLVVDGQQPAIGNWVGSSETVDGRAEVATSIPDNSGAGVTMHNREIGHCVDSVPAGTNVLTRVVLHFN